MSHVHQVILLSLCVCVAVEAAGGGGLQLFVETGVKVDSELIRHFCSNAGTERDADSARCPCPNTGCSGGAGI